MSNVRIHAQHQRLQDIRTQLLELTLEGLDRFEALYEEIDYARRVFRKGGFAVVNVTNRPIEETADEVIALISRYFEHKLKRWGHR